MRRTKVSWNDGNSDVVLSGKIHITWVCDRCGHTNEEDIEIDQNGVWVYCKNPNCIENQSYIQHSSCNHVSYHIS